MNQNEENGLIYRSAVMREVITQINTLSNSQATVLITGESGTGKELVAKAIHQSSIRRENPFIAYNCSSIPREIAESELFGHRRGSFTGANHDFTGIIRSAETGTLFLDEIGDLSLEIQPKLLRFLENREVQPLGTAKPIKTNVRVIAATNLDLGQMVAEGKYRADLLYRINTITITLSPLRERRDDIPLLAQHFLKKSILKEGKQDIQLSPDLVEGLMNYNWPGNIRQLANVIEQMVVYSHSHSVIGCDRLPGQIKSRGLNKIAKPLENPITLPPSSADHQGKQALRKYEESASLTKMLNKIEQELISTALAKNNNNISRTAKALGISRFGLQRKLKRFAER